MSKIRAFFSSFKLTTPTAIIISAVILSGSHIVYGYIVANGTPASQTTLFAGKAVDESDFVEGNADSKIVVIEYSDPECPFCVTLHPNLKRIRNEYASKIAFVYRHFPLTQIHPNAFDESKAIACAGSLGGTPKFYEYVDKLYGFKSENQTTQLPTNGKEEIAGHIGLDIEDFKNCVATDAAASAVDISINAGVQAGVQGTPATFVLEKTRKGYEIIAMIDGARPYEYIKAAIDQALAQ